MFDAKIRREDRPQVEAELEQIRCADGGTLEAARVVAFAEDEDTAIHKYLMWDDTEAAGLYRIEQARCLIRAVVTVLPRSNTPTRAYVSLPADRRGVGYRATADVMTDDDLRAQLLACALDDLDRFREKYRTLTILEPIFRAVDLVASDVAVDSVRHGVAG